MTTVDLVEPAFLSVPDYSVTLGPEVAAISALAGFPPDPEQRMLLDAAFAVNPETGRSVAFEVVVIAPRQNLKTGFEKQYALGQLFVRKERLVVWSAHEFSTAEESLTDVEALIDGSPDLRRLVKLTSRGNVAKRGAVPVIETKAGARLIFKTRTAGGGRGLSGRKVILDEGYALQPAQVGALDPIMLAQPDPQKVVGSSACRPESAVLWDMVQRGRASARERAAGGLGDQRLVFAEWCAPEPKEACDLGESCSHARNIPGCGCDKPEVIVLAHSAVRRGRILLETVVDLRKTMPPDEFSREVMGWHDEPVTGLPPVDAGQWAASRDPRSEIVGKVALAIDVKLDETAAVIAASGRRPDGRRHVEVTGKRTADGAVLDHRPGTGWTVGRTVEIATNCGGPCVLVIDPASPAGALVPELEAAGFVRVTKPDDPVPGGKWPLYLIGGREYAQACGALAGDVRNDQFRHLDQQPLNDAVQGTRTKAFMDSYKWSRKDSSVDISPFVAVTLARHGHALFGEVERPAPFFMVGT